MVGTSAILAFFALQAIEGATQRWDRADDHGASRHLGSVSGVGEAAGLAAADADLIKADGSPPSGRTRNRSVGLERPPNNVRTNHRHVAPRMRFIIETWMINHLMTSFAHFT